MYKTSDQEEDVNKPYPEKPAAPNAASEKGEPNTQKTLCHEGVQDDAIVPGVQDVPNVQYSIVVPVNKPYLETTAAPRNITIDSPLNKNSIDVQDVPRTNAHNIFNTKSHQTNLWQTSPRPRRSPCLPPPRERGSRGHN